MVQAAGLALLDFTRSISGKLEPLRERLKNARLKECSIQKALKGLRFCLDKFDSEVPESFGQDDRQVLQEYRDEADRISNDCKKAAGQLRSINKSAAGVRSMFKHGDIDAVDEQLNEAGKALVQLLSMVSTSLSRSFCHPTATDLI